MSYVLTVPYTDLNPLPPNDGLFHSPRLLTLLEYNNARIKFFFHSVVDSGADNCIFPTDFGKALGIPIENGVPAPSSGFGGAGMCYYHMVNVLVRVDGIILRFKCFAGFSDQMNASGIGLLGRHGFFELFEEVIFDQRNRLFKLKVPGERPQTPNQIPANPPQS